MQQSLHPRPTFLAGIWLCLFCLTLLFFRLWYKEVSLQDFRYDHGILAVRHPATYIFMAWNLFLAWVPFWLSFKFHPRRPRWYNGLLFLVWMGFLPNAPYLVTDLIHLRGGASNGAMFDSYMMFLFAATGLYLGLYAIRNMERFLEQFLYRRWSIALVVLILAGTSYGVYMGRYQRWNTWDLLVQPLAILEENARIVLFPLEYLQVWGLVALTFSTLLFTYYMLFFALEKRPLWEARSTNNKAIQANNNARS